MLMPTTRQRAAEEDAAACSREEQRTSNAPRVERARRRETWEEAGGGEGRQCLNAFRYESETEISSKREFLRARGRPLVEPIQPRSSLHLQPTKALGRVEGGNERRRRHGWWKRQSFLEGGWVRREGEEGSLGEDKRERRLAEDGPREAETEGHEDVGLREGEAER